MLSERSFSLAHRLAATIAFAVEPRPLLSGAWWRRDVIHHSGMAKVSTPFRVWTG